MATQDQDKFEGARRNAMGWMASIEEMLAATKEGEDTDVAREQIWESVLSVLVRDDWHAPGQLPDDGPQEYEILLSTGGPALRIYGRLDQYNQPDNAELQMQDWFTPWVPVDLSPDQRDKVLEFAQQFYFEG